MAASKSLDRLLGERTDLWRGRRRGPEAVLATGRAALDAALPGGGWPRGRLIELVPERFGSGELELLQPVLAERTRHGQPVMFIAPPLVPCPQALLRSGVDLARLAIVRHRGQALWCAEQALKSGLCGIVVVWPAAADVQERAIRRLVLAAEHGQAPLFVCYPPGCRPPPSLASLRLAIRAGGEVELLRSRMGAGPGAVGCSVALHLQPGNVVALQRRR